MLTISCHTTCKRSSMPFTPFGIFRKSPFPISFCLLVNTAWSVATSCRMPPARACLSAGACCAPRMGGLMTYCAATVKLLCHIIDSFSAKPDATGSPITLKPCLRALAICVDADLLSKKVCCVDFSVDSPVSTNPQLVHQLCTRQVYRVQAKGNCTKQLAKCMHTFHG